MKPSPGSLPLRLHIRNGVALLLMALLTLNAYPSHAQLFKAVPDRAESLVRSISASHDVSSLKPRRAGASPTPFAISISAPSRDKKATETDTESAPGTPHKIGFGRNVPQLASVADTATCLQWQSTAQVGMIAAISISSPEAVGIRLGILVHRLPAEATVRFYNQEAETAYEISGEDIMESIQRNLNAGDDGDAALTYWSPNIEGEEATLEIELPPGINPDTVEISIPRISHFFRSPLAAQGKSVINKIGDAADCEIDATCYSAWNSASNATAKMSFVDTDGYSYLCTGTLLNDMASSGTPYFLSAQHCISQQTVASTLQTYWFYRSTSCNSSVLNAGNVTLTGGATLLYSSVNTDTSFMRLSNTPPAGATYIGWESDAPALGDEVAGVHHPEGDLQKITFGLIEAFEDCTVPNPISGTFSCSETTQAKAEYLDITLTDGITEGGSSGSGLFITSNGTFCLIGQLRGGNSSCNYPDGSNTYGRFDVAYNAALYQWLSAGSTFSLSVSKSGDGSGTVTSTPSGIDCGTACSASYANGTSVTITATPTAGSTFFGWSGVCSGTGASCSFVMNAAKTVTANFSTGTFSLGTALDNNNLAWATGGNASFTPQTTTFYSGGSAAQTGSIGNSQSTYLSTSVTGPGTLSFYWKVSSEEDYDIFSVYLDGVKKYSWSGYSSWNRIDLTIPTGTHTVKWQYVKDKSDATGEDAGWVDYVVFTSSTQSGSDEVLYYPHIAANAIWQTEVAIINTSDQTVSGTLKAFSDGGNPVESKDVTLLSHGRRQIIIADEFTYHTDIGYIIFETDSDAVEGYTKFYQEGIYRAAIPAVKEVNASDIHIPHIASNADWWTGVSLVNTTSETKNLTLTFDNGQSVPLTFNPNEHKAFSIRSLFNDQPQLDIQSAVISNASGIIGLELFGSFGWGTQLEGILLTDNAATTLYYPHVAAEGGWTGVAAYNTSDLACTMTMTPYTTDGSSLLTITSPSIGGREKYVGTVSDLGLPAGTAWFMIKSTQPLSGFELFGTDDGSQLASYMGGGGIGSREGVFPKIEKNGWTGIAFVNTEAIAAAVTLIAYDDDGTPVDNQDFVVLGYGKKMFNSVEAIFSQAISSATYITYSSDRNVVGFQLNGSKDETMLDGLPALGGTN